MPNLIKYGFSQNEFILKLDPTNNIIFYKYFPNVKI